MFFWLLQHKYQGKIEIKIIECGKRNAVAICET